MTTDAAATVKAVRNAARTLDHGVTTVRDMGGRGDSVIQVARGVERGLLAGPRILAAGRALTITGGHGHQIGFAREVDGPDGLRRAVREEIRAGATAIKLVATGGVLTPGDHPRLHGVHSGGARRGGGRGAFVEPDRRRARDRPGRDRPGGPGGRGLDRARFDALGRGSAADEGARDLPRPHDLGDPRHHRPSRRGAGVRGRESDGARRSRARRLPALGPHRREDRLRNRRGNAVQPARLGTARDRPHGRVGDDPAARDALGDLERGRAAPARRTSASVAEGAAADLVLFGSNPSRTSGRCSSPRS